MTAAATLATTVITLYLCTAIAPALVLSGRWRWRLDPRLMAIALGGPAALLHLWLLASTSLSEHGLALGLGAVVSLFAWQTVVVVLLASFRWPVHHLGLVVWPLAALAVLTAALSPGDQAASHLDARLASHVLLSTLAYGLLGLAALQAMVYAYQDRDLRRRGAGSASELPSLELMERILFRLIAVGLIALSLALITGALFIENLLAQHLVHKTVLSTLAWLLLSVLMWGRISAGWRGRRVVRIMLSGFAILVLAYFGSRVVLELLLDSSWS